MFHLNGCGVSLLSFMFQQVTSDFFFISSDNKILCFKTDYFFVAPLDKANIALNECYK